MTDIPADTVLPCGCLLKFSIDDGKKVMTVVPCRLECGNLRSALELADERDVPVNLRAAP